MKNNTHKKQHTRNIWAIRLCHWQEERKNLLIRKGKQNSPVNQSFASLSSVLSCMHLRILNVKISLRVPQTLFLPCGIRSIVCLGSLFISLHSMSIIFLLSLEFRNSKSDCFKYSQNFYFVLPRYFKYSAFLNVSNILTPSFKTEPYSYSVFPRHSRYFYSCLLLKFPKFLLFLQEI